MSKLVGVMVSAALILPVTASAAVFADRTAFLAALAPSPTTITFEGIVGTPGFAPYTTGGYAAYSGYSLNGVGFTGIAPHFYSYIFDPVSSLSLAGSASGMFDQLGGDFGLSPGVMAFGLDLGSSSGSGNVQILINRVGAPQISTNVTLGSGVAFFGYTGAEAITSVSVRDPLTSAVYVKFDNVTFGTVAGGVPEPATWSLLIGGFGAVGAAMRRRVLIAADVAAAA